MVVVFVWFSKKRLQKRRKLDSVGSGGDGHQGAVAAVHAPDLVALAGGRSRELRWQLHCDLCRHYCWNAYCENEKLMFVANCSENNCLGEHCHCSF